LTELVAGPSVPIAEPAEPMIARAETSADATQIRFIIATSHGTRKRRIRRSPTLHHAPHVRCCAPPLPLRAMDAEGKQRVAMNEATFRKVNEGMEVGQEPGGLMTFICECGRLGCTELILLTRAEYEALRADPRRFALLAGHEILDVERVVERHERYLVVEKSGDPAEEIVEHTDPRRPHD
jgi:hypothetical protein